MYIENIWLDLGSNPGPLQLFRLHRIWSSNQPSWYPNELFTCCLFLKYRVIHYLFPWYLQFLFQKIKLHVYSLIYCTTFRKIFDNQEKNINCFFLQCNYILVLFTYYFSKQNYIFSSYNKYSSWYISILLTNMNSFNSPV